MSKPPIKRTANSLKELMRLCEAADTLDLPFEARRVKVSSLCLYEVVIEQETPEEEKRP